MRKSLAVIVVAALAALLLPAQAATAAVPVPPGLLSAEPLPTWQTNGEVYAVEVVGGVAYVGGKFTAVRPPGAAAGQQEVPRRNLAAFDAVTGELLPFAPDLRAPNQTITGGSYDLMCGPGTTAGTFTCDTVFDLRKSPDGSTLYVGGDFTKVDGKDRAKIAAFSTSTRALSTWRVSGVNGRVRALAVSGSTVYAGGHFTAAGGQTRTRLAAFDRTTGALRPWTPSADLAVFALALAPDGSRVVVGGMFDNLSGTAIHGLGAVDAQTGASVRWDGRAIPRVSSTRYSYVTDLVLSGDTVYAASNGEGTFDGRVASNVYTGAIEWVNNCLGATWAIEVIGDVLYSGHHAHNCSMNPGGMPESFNVPDPDKKRHYRLLAEPKDGATRTIYHWFPNTNGMGGNALGPRDMATDGSVLWLGGEFTTVNEAPQQSITRFSTTQTSDAPLRPDVVSAESVRPGQVTVTWITTYDRDDEALTYTIFRGATAVHTVTAESKPWLEPVLRFTDTGLEPGSTQTYQVRATDPHGQSSAKSFTSPAVVVAGDRSNAYAKRVLADGATSYWRLDEPSGETAGDAAGGMGAYLGSGLTRETPGAVASDPSDSAMTFNGTNLNYVSGASQVDSPSAFSLEFWMRTTTRTGGKIVGFGNGTWWNLSSVADRHVYMNNSGQLLFGMAVGTTPRAVKGAPVVNDGQWHHVVATASGGTLTLYVDGAAVASTTGVTPRAYTGTWRLGGDSLTSWPERPTATWWTGALDDVSVYGRALTAAEVAAHRSLARSDTEPPSVPAGVTATVTGQDVALTWSASNDNLAVTGYDVHRSTSSDFTPTAATKVGAVTGTSFAQTQVAPGTWSYRVVARDAAGNVSDPSATAQAVVVGPDTTAPSAPSGGSATVVETPTEPGSTVDVTWTASTDDRGVAGYDVHRSSSATAPPSAATKVGSTTATSLRETSVPAGTWYYRIVATDAAGNRSTPSEPIQAAVAATPVTLTVSPQADAWVDAASPATNAGRSWVLSADGTPEQVTYLSFAAPAAPAGTTLTGATLRVRTTGNSWAGSTDAFQVRLTDGSSWSETAVTYANRPAVTGPVLGTLAGGSVPSTTYEIALTPADVTALLGSSATVAITTAGSDNGQFSSRESSTGKPELELVFE